MTRIDLTSNFPRNYSQYDIGGLRWIALPLSGVEYPGRGHCLLGRIKEGELVSVAACNGHDRTFVGQVKNIHKTAYQKGMTHVCVGRE